ncbi:DUF6445 family protein [uncultured Thiothrix sp.]|jgi:hypothetical protein|uniref:DUF6445 family protein n=1 Tax=uncultured Thiothrix sp. TaxID=223185 RepID=UPI0026208D9E|nr:DUF6445 family protein [uncultured Thiothrix sp.]HMT94132.1 DUF6445 family protein [Thiolinea sp.]
MHETLLEDIKFHLDHLDSYDRTYFLAGWIFSTGRTIESIRVDTSENYSSELINLEVRHDVNNFYKLPEGTQTGFKFILTPDEVFATITFSVKFQGESAYKVFAEIRQNSQVAAKQVSQPAKPIHPAIRIDPHPPAVVVVDNFYSDPDAVREYAMTLDFNPNVKYHKGSRTEVKTIFEGTKETFEKLLGRKISVWESHIYNGVFQYCTAEEPLVYHTDNQSYAAVVFLTPDAPPECGTSFYKSKLNGLMAYPTPADCKKHNKSADELFDEMFAGNFYDKTRWDLVDTVGNVYNRLVIFDAKRVHAASAYFGDNMKNSRLFHMFFFDIA